MSAEASSSIKPKRQLVKAACQTCQKRKVKCSGERPTCMLCQQRNQTCIYDAEAGVSRVEAVRRRNKQLLERNADYELVYDVLQNSTEPEAVGHLRQLRDSPNVESYARMLRRTRHSTSKRASNEFMDDGVMSNASSLSGQSYDPHGETHFFADSLPTTAYTSSPPTLPTMVDPRLDQQSLYNFPDTTGAAIHSLCYRYLTDLETLPQTRSTGSHLMGMLTIIQRAETWPFQDSSEVPRNTIQSNNQTWMYATSQSGSFQPQYPNPPFNVQMSQAHWPPEADIDPVTGQPVAQRRYGFDG